MQQIIALAKNNVDKDEYLHMSDQQRQKYPSQMGILVLLNWHLIEKILFYCCEIEELEQNQGVCKLFRGLIQPRISQITQTQQQKNILLEGRQNMDELYLALDIPNNVRQIYGIKVEVYTKDQGWASVNSSSSWVVLRILDETKEPIDKVTVASNLRQKDFQRINKRFDFKNDREFMSKIKAGQSLGIFAISEYPGWETYIKMANIVLYYD